MITGHAVQGAKGQGERKRGRPSLETGEEEEEAMRRRCEKQQEGRGRGRGGGADRDWLMTSRPQKQVRSRIHSPLRLREENMLNLSTVDWWFHFKDKTLSDDHCGDSMKSSYETLWVYKSYKDLMTQSGIAVMPTLKRMKVTGAAGCRYKRIRGLNTPNCR